MKKGDMNFLIKLARDTISDRLGGKETKIDKKKLPKELKEKKGCFVTLHSQPSHELRGCIGIVEAIYPIYKTVMEAAISAAFNDPRFPPLSRKELGNVIIEISVLTTPEEIKFRKPSELFQNIRIGEDGLIVSFGYLARGLLLPQVAVEQDWTAEEFVRFTCRKAGIPPDSYLHPNFKIEKFQAIIFKEETPGGKLYPSS